MTFPLRVGLIGCGRISDIYIENCATFPEIDIVACASLDIDESRAKAAQHSIAKACTPESIYSDDSIDCILNLTIPAAHVAVASAALESGKHVYGEKPFATSVEQGRELLGLARRMDRVIGSAPDTFLGGRWQTCRELLDSGVLGKPTGFAVFVGTHGVERHHPNPDFYYQHGGGPLLDLGPYYLSTLVFLLGPMKRVCGMSRRTFDQRMIESEPRRGEMMQVEVDTHVQCMVEFASGVIGSMTISFDVWDSETPRMEIYCENGTVCIPDPDPVHGANVFGGEIWYRTRETSRWAYQPRRAVSDTWQKAVNKHGYNHNSRGLGLLDMVYAIREGRSPRASAVLAHHIDEAMHGILSSNHTGSYYQMQTTAGAPALLPHEFPQRSNRQ